MDVDVSPDGKTLVFDLLGDLYTVPAAGGAATQLTRGIALNVRPVWSPDGKKIAYLSDFSGGFHVNVMDLHGTFRQVLGSSDNELEYEDAQWTPDGQYVAAGGSVYSLAGRKMTAGKDVRHPLRFSADGQVIYGLDSGKLVAYDRAAKNKTVLPAAIGEALNFILSPDCRWWCYIKDSSGKRSLIVQDLTGKTSRVLISSLYATDPRYAPGWSYPHFSFSPDSKSVFIGYGGKIHRIDVESGTDAIIPFIAHVRSDLGPLCYNTYRVRNDSVKVRYIRSAHASPDGRHLVFSALSRIYIQDVPGGKPQALAPQELAQFQPVYSPDGQWIAFVTWCDTSGGALWRVPAAGGRPEQLSHIPGQYQHPSWSPNGSSIAVVRGKPKLGLRNDPGIGELTLIPVKGGIPRIIDDSVPLWNQLAFSSDGHRITYTPMEKRGSPIPPTPQLVSRDLDGNDLKVIAVDDHLAYYEDKLIFYLGKADRTLSPDGRFLVYSAAEDLYLVPVCQFTIPVVNSEKSKQSPAIRFAEGVDAYWEQDGKTLAWSYGNKFYRINPNKIVRAAEKAGRKEEATARPENGFITATVQPDQVIPIDLMVPGSHARSLLVFRNIRIITMQRDWVIENGTIIMKDGRISAVGPAAAVPIPAGAEVRDLHGATVMPGFVDLHLHMQVPGNVFPQQSWMFLVNLAYGVTTARDPAANYDNFGYGELLAAGRMTGPRLYSVGRAVRFNDGIIRCDRPEDADAVVRKRAELGGIVVKDYMVPRPRLARQWLLQACRRYGLNITNEGTTEPLTQLGMMKDGCSGVEHNPQWGDVYKDLISFVAASGTYFTPTLQVATGVQVGEGKEYFKYKFWHQPNEKLKRFTFSDTAMGSSLNGPESYEAILKTIYKDSLDPLFLTPARIDARIRLAGGRVTMGSHGESQGVGTHNEIWALRMGGLSNLQALQAATIMGAEALGIQKDVGSVEPGKIADLIILNKNPLDDIHNTREIRYVMKDGILYDGETLDELWPVPKKCPEWRMHEAK